MVKGQFAKKEVDPAEAALDLYEREEKDFQNHWVWKELRCKPDEFFEAVKNHVEALNIPKHKWEKAYNKARESIRIRALEKRSHFSPARLKMIGAIRA